MAIKFEIYEMPKFTVNQEVVEEHITECVEGAKRAEANLRKKFKKISIAEGEAWKKSRRRG